MPRLDCSYEATARRNAKVAFIQGHLHTVHELNHETSAKDEEKLILVIILCHAISPRNLAFDVLIIYSTDQLGQPIIRDGLG
ncbi:hypothetical protein HFO97_08560 [Rhizobium leguminosarum]|uniref:hypothetical protein n=1 Tax=Rhizobium leguminosarum TaxID=384 RepID=UPI001C949CD9|nr:hypothetical protein [Rhizobium leguminosarum]MBY5360017.1 hypothetical protein [Rhizobium leguminosarum]